MSLDPRTKYAKRGDVHIAYQVVGDGPLDVVVVRGFISHLETAWENPSLARCYRRLASFARLILFDKRGTGLSDRVSEHALPTLEQRMDDLGAVMDAADSERAALFALSEGAQMSLLFAATYPERTTALIIFGGYAKLDWERSFGGRYWGETVDGGLERLEREWGEGTDLHVWAPSIAASELAREAWARAQRLAASPGATRAIMRMAADIDARPILPAVRVPTLILHRADDVAVDVSHGRHLAERILGAKYVELAGSDHQFWVGEADAVIDEIQEFLTGVRPDHGPERVLATVLFTDIAGSTRLASELGDRRWGELLEAHHSMIRDELRRFRGREIDTAGDGFFATFDGPARAIRCAYAIVERARGLGIDVRAGLHTGECEHVGEKVGGIAVHIAARVMSRAQPGEVLVSRTVKDLVAGGRIAFADTGRHLLEGVPGEWPLLSVTGLDAAPDTESTADDGGEAEDVGRTAVERGGAPTPLSSARVGVFRKEGEFWTITYEGRTIRLRDSRGLTYLARLIAGPGNEFHALELTRDVYMHAAEKALRKADEQRQPADVPVHAGMGDAGEVLDAQARAAYRARLEELREDLEEAEAFNDPERASRARGEMEFLTSELAAAVGLGGRPRIVGSAGERARVSVTRAIKAAVKRIEDNHPPLGHHLSATIKTGTFCSYRPELHSPIDWEL